MNTNDAVAVLREALTNAMNECVLGQGSYGKNYDGNKLAKLVREALTATDSAATVAKEGGGTQSERFKEAAIAWEVCASIHREYAKGKDPLFKTRQADFVKSAKDARANLSNLTDKPVRELDKDTVRHIYATWKHLGETGMGLYQRFRDAERHLSTNTSELPKPEARAATQQAGEVEALATAILALPRYADVIDRHGNFSLEYAPNHGNQLIYVDSIERVIKEHRLAAPISEDTGKGEVQCQFDGYGCGEKGPHCAKCTSCWATPAAPVSEDTGKMASVGRFLDSPEGKAAIAQAVEKTQIAIADLNKARSVCALELDAPFTAPVSDGDAMPPLRDMATMMNRAANYLREPGSSNSRATAEKLDEFATALWGIANAELRAALPPTSGEAVKQTAVERMLETNQLDELGREVARLQTALCFWLPSVTDREDDVADRILQDAFLLCGIDGNIPDDFKTAQDLGWVTLAAPAAPVADTGAVKGPWHYGVNRQADSHVCKYFIASDDFTHDVRLYLNGDFSDDEQRRQYGKQVTQILNAAPASPAPTADSAADARDAARWRALLGSARIRILGTAGIREPEDGYAHFGMEIWTIYGASLNAEQTQQMQEGNVYARDVLTKYADIAAMSTNTGEGE